MKERLEWLAGPLLVTKHTQNVWNAGKNRLEPVGKASRLLIGQVRDKELGNVLNWAMYAPRSELNARIALEDFSQAIPKALDWSGRMKPRVAPIPPGWQIAPFVADIEIGVIL